MSTEDWSRDEGLIYEIVFNHFKRHKVEISSAIKKEFPFLEILRDRELITNKMYEDCQESCRNLVPVQRVVYNVLSELEKTFDLSLLEVLFSEVNRREYPDLNIIYKDFEDEVHEKICYPESDEDETVEHLNAQLRLEQGPDENYPSLPWNSPYPSNNNGTAPPENGLSEHLFETEQINDKKKGTTNDTDVPEGQQLNEQCAQESEPSGAELPNHGIQLNSCSVHLVDIKKEKPFFSSRLEKQTQTRTICNQVSDVIVISSDESTEISDEDEPPKASTSALTREPGPMDFRKSPTCRKRLWETERSHDGFSESSLDEAPPRAWSPALRSSSEEEDALDFGYQSISEMSNKKRRVSSSYALELNNEEEPQETSSSALRSQSDTMDIRSNSTLKNHRGKIREKRRHRDKINGFQKVKKRSRHEVQPVNNRVPWKRSKPKGIKAVNTGPLKRYRKRGPRIPRIRNMNFQTPRLPVTCGQAKGILCKEIMKQGTSAKCIEMLDGKKLTLKEFEIEGNHEKSKNWRLSVRCGGWPLKYLIQKGFLPNPPRTRKKTIPEFRSNDFVDPYPENSNECEVCRRRGKLFCCDTCPRSFHRKCHIHHIDPEKNPWSCIFCQIRAIQEGCPDQPGHRESEVLEKKMLHEEQLKCEFLLLKIYCCSESPFFASEPYYNKKVPLKKCMWLDKIRKKLVWKQYRQVKQFVQDMHLIFQNHKIYYKDHKFTGLGLRLEAKFEDNFKNIFAVEKVSRNSSQSKPITL